MSRPVTLFTGQWADLALKDLVDKVVDFGYDGVELACWGDHFDVRAALDDPNYCKDKWDLLSKKGLGVWAISNHLVGQAVCDLIDQRHKAILPPYVWGDGDPEGVRQRAAKEMKNTARAARKLADVVGHDIVVCGFTGSSIWHLLYSFPPVSPEMIEAGYKDFELSLDLQGQTGNKIFNGKEVVRPDPYNFEKHVFNRWTGPGTSNTEPRPSFGGYNYSPSDRFVQDGSFLRLRNVTFSYILPSGLSDKLQLSKAVLYLKGTNLFTLAKFTGYTPEIGSEDVLSNGIDNGIYPVTAVYSFGLNITF